MPSGRKCSPKPLAALADAASPGEIEHGIGVTGQRFRWPGGIVPFTCVAALRPLVDQAIAHWHANTRIRLVERTAANAAQFLNWVSLVKWFIEVKSVTNVPVTFQARYAILDA